MKRLLTGILLASSIMLMTADANAQVQQLSQAGNLTTLELLIYGIGTIDELEVTRAALLDAPNLNITKATIEDKYMDGGVNGLHCKLQYENGPSITQQVITLIEGLGYTAVLL